MMLNPLLALLILAAPAAQEARDPDPGTLSVEEAEKTLTAGEVKQHVTWLASDEMKGRDTPSPELDKAAAYVAAEFRRLGLKGLGDDGGFIRPWIFHKEKAPNCVGLLEGSDPKLKEEVVILGGHMDHIGEQGREVMNGADDNASGATGVLELAEAFASLKVRPKRSLLFITFSGEEKGLLGSAAYVKDPAIPIGKCVAMINLDMVGRSTDGYLFVGGVGTSEVFPEMVRKASEGFGFNIETGEGGLAPSDNSNFHKAGLPVLFFFTHIHPDYHGADDTAEKINTEGEAKILRMAFRVLGDIAGRPERIPFTRNNQLAMPKDFDDRMRERFSGGGAAARRPRLGVEGDADERGFVVNKVTEGLPAHKAGIEVGDVVTSLGGAKIRSFGDFRAALGKVKFGETVEIVVLRGGSERTLKVVFEKP